MKSNNLHVVSAVSHRSDGSMMSNRILQRGNVQQFLEKLEIPYNSTHFMKQVHGDTVVSVDEDTPQIVENADGLVTNRPHVFLGVVTADCVPVSIVDLHAGVVGIAHAGYKGLLAGVVSNLIIAARELGASNKSIQLSIGPCIGSCCYDIDEKRAESFSNLLNSEDIFRYHGDKIFLDLPKVAKNVAEKEGIHVDNIKMSGKCTKCNLDSYFSYRGDSSDTFGEFMTVIGMKEL